MYTTKQIASMVGCSDRTARRVAVDRGIGERVGNILVFTEADVAKLRAAVRSGPGNPGFKLGNYRGKPARKRRKKS